MQKFKVIREITFESYSKSALEHQLKYSSKDGSVNVNNDVEMTVTTKHSDVDQEVFGMIWNGPNPRGGQ